MKSEAWKALIKFLLTMGVQLLGKAIPFLGGFVGGPLGFLASWAIGYLTGVLYDWIERLAKFAEIDSDVADKVTKAKEATAALNAVQKNKEATHEQHEKAIAEFIARHRDLGRLRLLSKET